VQVAVPAAASQILDVLLHNAIRHGRGAITVSAVQRAEYVAAQVADEGPRPSGNAIFQRRPDQRSATSGEGIGLALAAELAESLGGHLLLDGDETTTFLLILPSRE
jgi:signal transduction histidine kinase